MAEDRTSEFLSLARTLPAADRLKPTGEAPLSATATGRYGGRHNESSYAQLKDFHTTAGGISRDIASTSALLAELTKVVRQKSLFQDDSHQVNDLVVRIKGSIENLNGRLDQAGQQIAIQKRQLGKNSQAGQEADNLVGQLKEEFVQATAGFKKVLQQRTDGMKETTDRKRQVYGGSIKDQDYASMVNLENKPPVYESSMGLSMGQGGFPTLDLTSGMSAGEPTGSGSQLPRPHGANAYDSGMRLRKSSSDPMPVYSGSSSSTFYKQDSSPLSPWDMQKMEQESGQDQMMQLIPDQDFLRERADAMEQVESNIVELGTIFNKLAVMVSEHREMVHRVEDNVDDANTSINLSLSTLTDTLSNLRTNRALFFKIFGILVAFIILFIVFLA